MEDAKTDSVNLAVNLGGSAVASPLNGAISLLPCPFCNGEMLANPYGFYHTAINDCWLKSIHIIPREFESWNRRAPISEIKDVERYRFVRSMSQMSVTQMSEVDAAMDILPDEVVVPTNEQFDAVVDAGMAAVAKSKSGISSNEPPAT